MNKSTDDQPPHIIYYTNKFGYITKQAENCGGLVSRNDVGKRVSVGRIGAGILRYLGPIIGKDGLFCGVELDRPEGKHNGTFQGVTYFECPDMHGIFAPIYKVELQTLIQPIKREQKLVRSAMPVFGATGTAGGGGGGGGGGGVTLLSTNGSATFQQPISLSTKTTTTTAATTTSTSTSTTPTITGIDGRESTTASMDVSMASISSLGSSVFGNSFTMNDSWNMDPMASSNATYTISTGERGCRYQLLEEIEYPGDLIDVDQETSFSQQLNTTSLVLEKSRIGVERLPVVDDELSTPIVENRQILGDQLVQGIPFRSGSSSVEDLYSVDVNEPNMSPVMSPARAPSTMSVDSSSNFSDHEEINQATVTNSSASTSPISRSFTITKSPVTGRKTPNEDELTPKAGEDKKRVEQKEKRPKKPKPPSIRELQNAPVPQRIVKPKPPTKTQLLMEQIKASIAADKNKPKKEIKSRLGQLIAVHPIPKPVTDENQEVTMTPIEDSGKPIVSPNPKRRRNEPLKAINCRTSARVSPSQPSQRVSSKPRQSLLPPKNAISKAPQSDVPKKMDIQKKKDDINSELPYKSVVSATPAVNPKSKLSRTAFSSTSFGPSGTRQPNQKSAAALEKQQKEEAMKMARLENAVRGFDVLAIVLREIATDAEVNQEKLVRQNKLLESHMKLIGEKYEEALSNLNAEHARRCENVSRNHKDEINAIEERYLKQLKECQEEMDKRLEESNCEHKEEIERISRDHQLKCAEIDGKLAEAEKFAEQLVRDKKTLEVTLSKDTNEKVAELSKEISSLNTALEMKSSENQKLRRTNAQLQLMVEGIKPRDIEISKLVHRVNELKELLDKKTNREKMLTLQYEALQKTARSQLELSESVKQENDFLRFKLEEMESSTSESEHGGQIKCETPVIPRQLSTPGVTLRQRNCQSEQRPSSTVLPSKVSSSLHEASPRHSADDDLLTRSVLSVYCEQGRSRLPTSDVDTIYAPEGTFIARGRDIAQAVLLDNTHDADDEGVSSGRLYVPGAEGDCCNAVTDSGISM